MVRVVPQQALTATDKNFLSSAFSDVKNTSRARATLPQIARSTALEFRLSEELLPSERDDGGYMTVRVRAAGDGAVARIPPLGDRIVAERLETVLELIAGSSFLVPWLEGSYARDGSPARVAYGYDDPVFSDSGARPAERTLVCLAADVCFDPYACGFWAATASTRTNLRIDLRSAAGLIWTWATFDQRPLAYALSAARLHPGTGEWMPFEPFTKLYRRILELHWEDDERCRVGAVFLSELTVKQLRTVRPGRSGKLHLYAPVAGALRNHANPLLRVDLSGEDTDPLAVFAGGAGLLLRKVFLGVLDPQEALIAVRALAAGVGGLSGDGERG